jgi:DNA-binding MarR family transcriptional regulator
MKRYALHDSVGYHATLAARLFERRLEAGLRRAGLGRLDWCVLLAVVEEGLSAPSDIAAFIGIDRTATSRALRRMEAAGLVSRHAAAGDGRRTEVRASTEGRRRLDAAIPAGIENAAHFRAKLSDEEHATLLELLSRLRAGEGRVATF